MFTGIGEMSQHLLNVRKTHSDNIVRFSVNLKTENLLFWILSHEGYVKINSSE